ncbi:hypothetical protein [Chitinophaga polysaccharea]|uniref:hypothetical protein n=1 Tax=Chitinophaga polysaccharea TaxID=1293035 RepID=UPI001159E3F3|nr:hypothetical protein [Chitinophaga polysaccharea]
MKFILLPGLLLACLLTLCSFHSQAQVRGTFVVNGDIDKYYPVVFTDTAWNYDEASELQIGRSNVHRDGPDGSWRGSIIATFRYHTTNWGHGSHFIDADIRQYSNPAMPFNKLVAGWKDATSGNNSKIMIIWLRGQTSYTYSSRYSDKVAVYDGTASGPLPYTEPLTNISNTFKTSIDNYVNTNGSTYSGNTYSLGGLNYFFGNVGIGTTAPTAKLEIAGAPAWTANGWGKADTTARPARYHMVITNSGNIGIGTTTPNNYKLAVEGTIGARRIKVTQQANWADFVFHPEYKLPLLQEVESFITKNGHLPEIPTAAEVKENGVDIGEMNKLLLQKVEELTLYLIQQQKEIEELKRKIK